MLKKVKLLNFQNYELLGLAAIYPHKKLSPIFFHNHFSKCKPTIY